MPSIIVKDANSANQTVQTLPAVGIAASAASLPVVLASDSAAIPVSGTLSIANFPASQPITGSLTVLNFPATQPVSGSLSIANFPTTQPVSGSLSISNFPATQPVSGSLTVSNFPATQAVSGSVTLGSGSAVVGSIIPAMGSGGNTQAQTTAAGTTFQAFAAQPCKQLTLVNNSGFTIEFIQGGSGIAVPVFNQSVFTIYGITDASVISVRRTDQSTTQQYVQARWEA